MVAFQANDEGMVPMTTYDKVFNFVVMVAALFILPLRILSVIDAPKDYWHWVGMLAWSYLLIEATIETAISRTVGKKEEK